MAASARELGEWLLGMTGEPDGGFLAWLARWEERDAGECLAWLMNERQMVEYIDALLEAMFPGRVWATGQKAKARLRIYRGGLKEANRVDYLDRLWRAHEIQAAR